MPKKKNTNGSFIKNFNFSKLNLQESYVSLALGAVVVIVIAVILFLILTSSGKGKMSITNLKTALQEQLGQQKDKTLAPKEGEYVVKSGDTLFLITQSKYGDGFRYPEVAALNKISNPDSLEVGTKLTLPDKLEGPKQKTYVVKEGDTLWGIAVRNYADGYRWVEIARVNGLANPDWIVAGQKLSLP